MKRRNVPVRKSSRRILAELRELVAVCFLLIDEEDLKEIANRTSLSLTTIWRLAHNQFTACVQWQTIVKLAGGAGLEVRWVDDEVLISLKR